jgi:hypothetical protein
VEISMSKEVAKRGTQFQPNHSLDFAVEWIDTSSGSTARCLFCVHEGREVVSVGAGSSRKRKRTDKIKYFSAPFQPHKYRSHHEGQHAAS